MSVRLAIRRRCRLQSWSPSRAKQRWLASRKIAGEEEDLAVVVVEDVGAVEAVMVGEEGVVAVGVGRS